MTLPVSFSARASRFTGDAGNGVGIVQGDPAVEPVARTPITMPPTTRRLYVTGHIVMALRDPTIGMGFNWRVDLWAVPGAVAHRSDDSALASGAEAAAQTMGDAEIVDLRPALKGARHPDAEGEEPIWGATHVRAVLELAWQKLDAIAQGRSRTTLGDTYDMRTMRVWLGPRERVRAARLGRMMARAAHGIELDEWNEWLERLAL